MTRRIRGTVAFLIAASIFIASGAPAELSITALVEKTSPSVVRITTYDASGKALSEGSGFFVSSEGLQTVVTNYHVIKGAHSAEAKMQDGRILPLSGAVAVDMEADLVKLLVDVKGKKVPVLESGSSEALKVGQRIVVIGSPLGLEGTVSDGLVSAIREIPAFGKILQITAPVSPGSSGSPVLNMEGQVVGVATFMVTEGQNLNFAVHAEKVALLKPGKVVRLAELQEGRETRLQAARTSFVMGVSAFLNERYLDAVGYFKEVLETDPKDPEAHLYLGWAYGRMGHHNEAIEAYKQAIRIKLDNAAAHYSLGRAYLNLGRYSEAIEAYKQAIRVKPDYAAAHYGLGMGYGNLGRYSEAIEAYKQAVRIEPDFADAHFLLGRAYGALGRYSEAIEAFREAVRLKPDDSEAHYVLGVTYLIIGDRGIALEEYKILKGLDSELANKLFNLIYK